MKLRCILCHAVAALMAFLFVTNAIPATLEPVRVIPRIVLNVDETRTVEMVGEVSPESVRSWIFQLNKLDDGKRAILIRISSPGGDIMAGIDMIKAIEEAKSPVTCVIDRYAASMAALISASCPRLMIHKYGILMFHEYSTANGGSRKEIKSRVAMIESIWDSIMTELARKTGLSREFLDKKTGEDWWLNANEASKYGLVVAVVDKFNVTNKRSYADEWLRRATEIISPKKEIE